MANSADLALANRLADAAGEAIRPLFRGDWSQERKSDSSPVTEVDRAAEAAMRAVLEAERPDDGIVGEEYGTRNEGAARQWVLDPIDGTISFMAGRPIFGTLISLMEGGWPVIGVIEPGIRAALAASRGGTVAVLGTEGTIRAGRYQQALARVGTPSLGQACSLLVPLAEEGWTNGEVAKAVAERYLAPLQGQVDTAILGCTHFPLLREVIQAALPGVVLVDSAESTAEAVADTLAQHGLLQAPRAPAPSRFLVTDNLERFVTVGHRFLGHAPDPVNLVDLPDPEGAFAAL